MCIHVYIYFLRPLQIYLQTLRYLTLKTYQQLSSQNNGVLQYNYNIFIRKSMEVFRKFNVNTMQLSRQVQIEISSIVLTMSFINCPYFNPGSNEGSHIAFYCHVSVISFNLEQFYHFIFIFFNIDIFVTFLGV